MIPNQWYPVLEAKKVKRRPVGIKRFGEALVLWRDERGQVVCMRDRCPHRRVALSRGRVVDGQLECPYHGFRYEAGGACTLMPCEGRDAPIPKTMRAETWLAREAHDLVWVFLGEAREGEALPDIPWFDEVGDDWRGASSWSIDWPLNYVRTLETNFDLHHFPFAHRSISFGTGARLDPYLVEVEGTHIKTWGRLRREEQSPDDGVAFRVELKAPSVTLLAMGDKLRGVVADCPIDEHNTWRYAKYRQDWLRLPLVGNLVAWLFLWAEFAYVQKQDLRMVETFDPKLPDLVHDHLVRADLGTAAYLKLRQRLLREAGVERQLPVVREAS